MGIAVGKPAVFLDRDGVLNQVLVQGGRPHAPLSPKDFQIIPDAAESLQRLKAAGFTLICVTNQPELTRGNLSPGALEEMHARLREALPLDAVFVCPHDDRDACHCRKPKPGLILQAAQAGQLDLTRSYMIGDRWRDVDAAHAVSIPAVFIDWGYQDRRPGRSPDATVRSLREATEWILRHRFNGFAVSS